MRDLDRELAADLLALRDAHRYRTRRTVEAVADDGSPCVRVDGHDCIAFCGNDYLGLSRHPLVVDAFAAAARRWGVGSGASHLVSGHGDEHHRLEQELAEFTGRPRALLLSTGYMANLAVMTTLLARGDGVLEDRLNHASLIDGGLASGARFSRYPHADPEALRRRLERRRTGRTLVATDGVFSMDGDVAPLRELAAACRDAGATLLVDDAHGFGVLGRQGRGSVDDARLGVDDVPIYMATLGKAVGTFGAFVAGSEALVETLIQRARTYVYTTALPPAVAAATRAALRVAQQDDWRRDRLREHVSRFREAARVQGHALMRSETAIQPLLFGDERSALAASDRLFSAGVWVPAIRPPTVPTGSSRLRVTFSASHEPRDVDRLIEVLASIAPGRSAA